MIDRLPELNRALIAVRTLLGSGPVERIPLDSVVRVCRDSVLGGRMPDHLATLRFAATVGLLVLDEDCVRATQDGLDFLALNPQGFFELTEEQARVLARRYYLDGPFADSCRTLFKAFRWSEPQQRLVWSELDDGGLSVDPWLIDHLCELRILVRSPGGLHTDTPMTEALIRFVEEPKGLTEEKLRQMLIEKEAVGDIGEELAIAYEQSRLRLTGRVVESHCVRRVSRVRVNAGYDIESFDDAAPSGAYDRFIEVKAARGKELRFFWTENEMKVAEKLGSRYWIYFIGGVDPTARTNSVKPLLFQDPLKSVLENSAISKTPQGFLVQANIRGERNGR